MLEILKPKTPAELWKKHKQEFLAIYASEQADKITHANLEKWFVDSKGNQYYRYGKNMALPIERMGKLKEFYTHLSSGVSGEEQTKLIDAMDKILSEGVGKPDTASKLGALIHILKERQRFSFHTETLYNVLAVQAIRHDEAPESFNNQIQMEKVSQFKEEVAASNAYFFFHQTKLQTPIDLLRFSPDEFQNLWDESQIHQATFQKMLDLILTSAPSKKPTPTSTNS